MKSLAFYKILAGGLVLMLVLVGGLSAVLVLQATRELDHFRKQEADLREQLAALQLDVQRKQETLDRLESDPEFLERVVRQRLGYSRPDEMVYRFDADPMTSEVPQQTDMTVKTPLALSSNTTPKPPAPAPKSPGASHPAGLAAGNGTVRKSPPKPAAHAAGH